MKRYTIKNPDRKTYRCPIKEGQEVSVKNAKDILCIFGDSIDRLGRYEDTGLEQYGHEKFMAIFGKNYL